MNAVVIFGIVVAALSTVVNTVVVVMNNVQGRKTHALVNSQHDIIIARNDQLTNTITNAGLEIPLRPKKDGK